MKILVCGAGDVGWHAVERLLRLGDHELAVLYTDRNRLENLANQFDVSYSLDRARFQVLMKSYESKTSTFGRCHRGTANLIARLGKHHAPQTRRTRSTTPADHRPHPRRTVHA